MCRITKCSEICRELCTQWKEYNDEAKQGSLKVFVIEHKGLVSAQ